MVANRWGNVREIYIFFKTFCLFFFHVTLYKWDYVGYWWEVTNIGRLELRKNCIFSQRGIQEGWISNYFIILKSCLGAVVNSFWTDFLSPRWLFDVFLIRILIWINTNKLTQALKPTDQYRSIINWLLEHDDGFSHKIISHCIDSKTKNSNAEIRIATVNGECCKEIIDDFFQLQETKHR